MGDDAPERLGQAFNTLPNRSETNSISSRRRRLEAERGQEDIALMDETEASSSSPPRKYLSVRQAAFIGVGAMVGAGIFALLGAAGEVAGAAVWLSFLIAGAIAALQGYSFAKLGARYPSAGGLLEYVAKGFGGGHFTGITAWLTYSTNAIVTAMVAVSFGSYAASMLGDDSEVWVKVFAALIIAVMTVLN